MIGIEMNFFKAWEWKFIKTEIEKYIIIERSKTLFPNSRGPWGTVRPPDRVQGAAQENFQSLSSKRVTTAFSGSI